MTGPTRSYPRLTAGVAGVSLVALGLAAPPAAAAETSRPVLTLPAGASGGTYSWDTPDDSVTAKASDVVGQVTATQPVRIVTVRTVAGRPTVTTRTVTGRASATAAVTAAQADDATVSVGIDHVLRLTETTSNDPYRASQWALTALGAEKTWTATTGTGVTVAVVDTGVQRNHPDLAGTVLSGVDLVGDVPSSTDGSNDENGHGTHVAGIVGAIANNKVGVAGLAPGVTILPVRVLDGDGAGYDSAIAQGIVKAVDRGAAVINLSVGGTEAGAAASAVRYALGKNVIVVAAAGNERQDGNAISYPAADAGVIGVAATDSTNKDAPFSNTGSYVDLAAPGVGIWSTFKGSTYKQLSGTSMATPYVSAAAALAKAVSPGLTPATMTTLLQNTATDIGVAGRDDATGYGLVNPYAAVCSLTSCGGSAPTTPPTTEPTTPTNPVASAFRLTTGSGKTVTAGTTISIAGTLTSAGAPLSGAYAEFCVRIAPAKTFDCTAATTGADGSIRVSGTATATTSIYLTYPGDAGTTASRTATATYPVAARVALRAGTKSVTATVAPARGQVVKLDRWTGKAWSLVTGKKVTASGAASFTKLKTGTYRVRVGATTSTVASTSGSLKVK
ncbi:S8 family serine peptidase [Cryptosporangium sp. NPDC048952]|uniref:S8 family serine peptidase n=1 Tax=Cryptosporangium sp. NPDC048952 TaxID=3363961 RepID=UPI00371C728D